VSCAAVSPWLPLLLHVVRNLSESQG
jgi:hypothetical protein